jgi:uncharacterized membrane-anchored protein YitT (DUF2179 family)
MDKLIKQLMLVFLGLVLTSLGIKILAVSHLTFGGTAGIATILTFVTDYSWGVWFFIANLPFFFISFQQLGKWFSVSSLLSITGISLVREMLDQFFIFPELNIVVSSVIAGILIGIGVTFVLNNGSSLGGIHILALYMDKKFQLNRGLVIFICDGLIILAASIMVGWQHALISIICITIASTIIGRYKKSPIKEMETVNSTSSLQNVSNS